MIIGRGLIANLFTEIDLDEVVFFASGVSNSSETRKEEFLREQNLVEQTLVNNPEKLFIYFSTCSIYDSSKYNSLYVLHKLHIEEIIKQKAKHFLVLRVSNAVGRGGNPNLLMNYLSRQILNDQELVVHQHATRNLIDVEDVKKITLKYINLKKWNKIVNVAYSENFNIPEIIQALEKNYAQFAKKIIENKGEHYSIDIHELDYEFELTSKESYLKNIIDKYYPS
ncbi:MULTISPECIES: NAD-dependent epimerase/dehydratase family protein [Empedobacter]|uniref:NAD-dependent epimerase n=1 Tax=Empedobacter falsenii TaxID=343874 RepID=A0AAW7DKA5_9FLAO|nr:MULTISPECIES: NAD-dependent epimerase/dehydratase family protein [Empedobacter]MDH1881994.1 NAD-dependent epimerase [Empedobacter sp. GD03797]MDM1551960.1 NAD-dependent epimerase [Empedobacter falsenii]